MQLCDILSRTSQFLAVPPDISHVKDLEGFGVNFHSNIKRYRSAEGFIALR
ncbi:hypothetical protein PIN31009_05283 [Pandoraea iniqua]|nr:hypothetical protein PIN31009_05283 [Pandoraea iniqua]